MRFPSTVGAVLALMAVLALIGIALAGCPEERPQETTVIPPADVGGDAEPGEDYGTPSGEPDDPLPDPDIPEDAVEVTLSEWKIEMPDTLPPGMTTFAITNSGTEVHSIEIEGQGIEAAPENYLEPGTTRMLRVDLKPGTYEVYCPIGNHAEKGMEMTLTVEE